MDYTKLLSNLIADLSIKDSALRLFLYLSYFNELHGFCCLTNIDLARTLGQRIELIEENINNLLECSLIEVNYTDEKTKTGRKIYIL